MGEVQAIGVSNWPLHSGLRIAAIKPDGAESDGGAGIEFTTTPRVNRDNSITLFCDVKERDTTNSPEPKQQQIRTNRRISSGDSFVLLAGSQADGKMRLIIVTATVLN